jgi:hypothetical protein
MEWLRRYARLAGAAALGTVLAGCGMPGAPLPPSLKLPEPVNDLAATRTGDHVALTWTMPTKDTAKLLLKGDVDVRVCRRDSLSEECLVAGKLQLAPGAKGSFSEDLPEQFATGMPRSLSYFVQLQNRNGRSAGLSNGAVVTAGEAPATVTGLEAEVRKEGVVLHWNDASEGPEATAVRLQRKLLTPPPARPELESKKQGVLAPPPERVDENLLVEMNGQTRDRAIDKDVRFGASYEYRAQRVIRVHGNESKAAGPALELDGPLSAPLRVDVADVFPPAVPAGLAAVAVAGENGSAPGIDLNWQPNTEPDLAGYIVYRREGSGPWTRISPAQPVVGPGFHDAQVEARHTYEYAVSAIDESGHESGRSKPASETVPNPE